MARFSEQANMVYTYTDAEKLINNTDDLEEMITHHQTYQKPRLKELRDYYKGNNVSILGADTGKRRLEEHLADNRATHNFAKYVSQFIQGYMMGVPLKTSYPDEKVDEQLRDINRVNDADEHNSELVLDQSIYGRAYELVYRSQDDEVKFTVSDVLDTFVIYDDTVEQLPIAAVRYISSQFEEGVKVHLYTDSLEKIYSMNDTGDLKPVDEKQHFFEGVPVVEYTNNKYRQGDFEDVLTLIDLYDNAQSDTANYMQDLNDAMLKIVGNLDIDVEDAKEMKDNNILMLQTEPNLNGAQQQADADYIYKQYDVQGTEAYKDRIFNNILLFTSIPNLLDDTSAGQQSGEAIKMKLFALSQKRATKERLFKKALRERYTLINTIETKAQNKPFDVNEISITFTENLPSMIDKELEWFTKAGGQLSNATLVDQLSFVENAEEELEKLEEEDRLGDDTYDFQVEEDDSDGEE